MAQVIKSGPVKQQTNLFFLKSWQQRELTITGDSFAITKPGIAKPVKELKVQEVTVQLRGTDLILSGRDGKPVTVRCKSEPEAKSWAEAAERVNGRGPTETADDAPVTTTSTKGMTRVLTKDEIATGAKLVSYDKVADSANVELIEEQVVASDIPASVMIHGGYSFGKALNNGVFKPQVHKELIQRRATYGSAQALMVLWRDARLMKEKGKIGEAVRLLRQHVDLAKLVFGENSSKVVESLQLLASFLSEQGSHDLAQKLLEEAAAIEIVEEE